MNQLFILSKPEAPWDDYGDILYQGMAGLEGGQLLLERTGPFIPPLSFPWSVVVTDAIRTALEPCGFTGYEFRAVVKHRIVRLDWHLWNREAEEPHEYPDSGEPEDYILAREHDPQLADSLGPLWELAMPEIPGLQTPGSATVNLAKYGGQDICQDHRWGYKYVSARFKCWLEENVGEWVRFQEAPILSEE